MIVEVFDIADNKKAFGHVASLPERATLGSLFKDYSSEIGQNLQPLLPFIMQVSINGRRIDNWQEFRPGDGDRVHFVVAPRAGVLEGLMFALQVVAALATIASFIMSLFAQPQTPSQTQGKRESDTYAFEGIRDTYQLGAPVAATYGRHRKGCQVLMSYLSMMPGNKGTKLHFLGSFGEGPVDAVQDIELNDMSITQLESVTTVIQLGQSSQGVVPGFETIKNTFFDGREITDKQKNGLTVANCSHVIYRTSAYDVEGAEFFVCARGGLYKSATDGAFKNNWSRYTIQYRPSAMSSMSEADAEWITWETRQIGGRQPIPIWDFGRISFPRPDQWDIRFTWRGARRQRPVGRVQFAIWLEDITEMRGLSNAFSNEVVVAVNAAPTAQLHGGQPNLTAVIRGLKPRVYTSVNSYTEQWTDNPAWPMVDWMTNSRYGMGADISHDEVDIQSFLDFATLADSLAETCVQSSAAGNCPVFGTANFFEGHLWLSSINPLTTGAGNDTGMDFFLRSKHLGVAQNGIVICKPCCPPDFGYGVSSPDVLNSWLDASFYLRTAPSGSPIFGPVTYVRSGTNQQTATMYGWIINAASSTAVLARWNGSRTDTYGTVLLTSSWSPGSGDFFYIAADNNYDTSSYTLNNIWLNVYIERNNIGAVDTEVIDSSASRIPYATLDRGVGVVAMPTNLAGDNHNVDIYNYFGETGLCYGSVVQAGTHELTCVQAIPHDFISR